MSDTVKTMILTFICNKSNSLIMGIKKRSNKLPKKCCALPTELNSQFISSKIQYHHIFYYKIVIRWLAISLPFQFHFLPQKLKMRIHILVYHRDSKPRLHKNLHDDKHRKFQNRVRQIIILRSQSNTF